MLNGFGSNFVGLLDMIYMWLIKSNGIIFRKIWLELWNLIFLWWWGDNLLCVVILLHVYVFSARFLYNLKKKIEITCPMVYILPLPFIVDHWWVALGHDSFFYCIVSLIYTKCILQIHFECFIQYVDLRSVSPNKNDSKSKQETTAITPARKQMQIQDCVALNKQGQPSQSWLGTGSCKETCFTGPKWIQGQESKYWYLL